MLSCINQCFVSVTGMLLHLGIWIKLYEWDNQSECYLNTNCCCYCWNHIKEILFNLSLITSIPIVDDLTRFYFCLKFGFDGLGSITRDYCLDVWDWPLVSGFFLFPGGHKRSCSMVILWLFVSLTEWFLREILDFSTQPVGCGLCYTWSVMYKASKFSFFERW